MANEDNSGGSRLLGSNQLQSSIDALTQAIQALVGKVGGSNSQGPAGSNTTFSSFGQTFGNQSQSPNGGGARFSGLANTLNGIATGGNGSSGGGGSLAGAVAGGLGGMASSALGSGSNYSMGGYGSLLPGNNMAAMTSVSAYLQQASIGYGNNYNVLTSLRNMAGFGNSTNNLAFNAQDAMQGMSTIYANSGSSGGLLSARGTNMYTMAGLTGITNPGMSFNQQAQMASQIYSPQMSMAMMQLGYGTTPLKMGGGSNGSAQVLQSMMQRWFGSSSVNMNKLNSNLGSNGLITANLQALGLSGDTLNAMENNLRVYNTMSSKGYTASQIDNTFTGMTARAGTAAHDQAISTLDKTMGKTFTQSLTQTEKNKAAVGTQRAGDQTIQFQNALAQSTEYINKFNRALNALINSKAGRGLSTAAGFLGPIVSLFGGAVTAAPGGGGGSPAPAKSPTPAGPSGAAMAAVGFAKEELGVPYVWGGESPGKGFDCSGLVQWSYSQAGVSIPRTSQSQWAALKGKAVPLNQVQAGDLLFTAGSDGTAAAPGHVAMMVSGSQLIQAPYTGTDVQLDPYNPADWLYAARPTGSTTAAANTPTGAPGSGSAGTSASGVGATGTSGLAFGMGGGSYSDEAAALGYIISGMPNPGASALPGFGAGPSGATTNGSSGSATTSIMGGGMAGASRAIMTGSPSLFMPTGGGGGISLNITVAPGAVVMNGAATGGAAPGTPGVQSSDVQTAGEALGSAIASYLERQALIQKLAAGVS